MAVVTSSPGRRSTRYRRRRPLPALLVIVVLSVVAAAVWINVLGRTEPEAAACPPPPPSVVGYSAEVLPATALDGVAPAPPQRARVRVLNGNGQRGQAGIVGQGLAELGFVPAAEPLNDPLHPDFQLTCHGQIRFGANGQAAARTVSMVVPCAELVRDTRSDDVVDLALGTEFTELRPSPETRSVLQRLVQLGQPVPPPAEPAQGGQAGEPMQPAIDPELIKALAARC